jgi:flagellar biosynthesis/type III secretory pathway M-ring protein FliF/YscJ
MIPALLKAWSVARRIRSMLSPTGWAVVGVLAAFLIFGAYCSHRGAQGERDRQEVRQAEQRAKAAEAGSQAVRDVARETITINQRQQERDRDAEAIPDGVPDERELRRRCRQLRDAGRDLPACRAFDG